MAAARGLDLLIEDVETARRPERRARYRLPFAARMHKYSTYLKEYAAKQAKQYPMHMQTLSARSLTGTYDERLQEGSGDVLLNRIFEVMGELTDATGEPFALRVNQHIMVSYILCSFLPFLYKQHLETHRERLLRQLKMREIREQLLIVAARREGKTVCVAVVVAALMIVVPVITGAVFSMNQRASRRVMKETIRILNMHPKGRHLLQSPVEQNQENLVLMGDHPNHLKTMFAFPGTPDVRSFSLSFLLFYCVHGRYVYSIFLFFCFEDPRVRKSKKVCTFEVFFAFTLSCGWEAR